MYIDSSVKTYLDELAAKKPVPGGGSAAALSAAAGIALISMTANYTVGNPKYKKVEAKAADLLVKSEGLRSQLEDLMDEDVRAFGGLFEAMKKLPSDSPELEPYYKDSLMPPFEICKACAEGLKLCEEISKWGNKNLITDIAVAAILLEGAFFGAKFNVYINLKYVKDMKEIEKIHKALAPLEKELPKVKEDILERCEEVIR